MKTGTILDETLDRIIYSLERHFFRRKQIDYTSLKVGDHVNYFGLKGEVTRICTIGNKDGNFVIIGKGVNKKNLLKRRPAHFVFFNTNINCKGNSFLFPSPKYSDELFAHETFKDLNTYYNGNIYGINTHFMA